MKPGMSKNSARPSGKSMGPMGSSIMQSNPKVGFWGMVSSGPAPKKGLYSSRGAMPQSIKSMTPEPGFGGKVSSGTSPRNGLY